MHKIYHVELIRKAVGNAFTPQALEQIISANLGQDSLLNLLKGHYHFDANGYRGAYRYVRKQEAEIFRRLKKGSAPAARAAFGRLTHALQDFYAHTNYVAMWLAKNSDFDLENGVPVPPDDPDILESSQLKAARVYYPLEALTIFPKLVPHLKRILPADSHANMNVDSPASGRLFPFAMSAALRRTEIIFETTCSRIVDEFGDEMRLTFLGQSS